MIERRKDNWTIITARSREFYGRYYTNNEKVYRFFGLVEGADDYYYGMICETDKELRLLSCVGNLDSWEFEFMPSYCPYCKNTHVAREITYASRYGSKNLLVEELPMQKCSECEAHFITPHQHEVAMRLVHEAYELDKETDILR